MVTIYSKYSLFLLNYIIFLLFSYKAGETERVHYRPQFRTNLGLLNPKYKKVELSLYEISPEV